MLKQAHAISEEIIEWRRDFHMHPELGFDVQRTAGIVATELEKLGYRVKTRGWEDRRRGRHRRRRQDGRHPRGYGCASAPGIERNGIQVTN